METEQLFKALSSVISTVSRETIRSACKAEVKLGGGWLVVQSRSGQEKITVTVLPLPEVQILYKPEQVFSGGARDEVLFQAKLGKGQGNWTYHWDFGDKGKAEGAAVNHLFQEPGTYVITLTLINGDGVARKPYSFSREIVVRGRGKE